MGMVRQPLMISYGSRKKGRGSSMEAAGGISVKKGGWSTEEDQKLIAYIRRYGIWNWNHMAKPAGLARSGKSCRLRWVNYLKPNIRHGNITKEEEEIIIRCHQLLGNKWAEIASKLEGRTDNEIKNYWHTRLKKRAQVVHKPIVHDNNNNNNNNNNNTSPSLLNEVDHSNIISLESLTQAVSNETINNSTTPNSEPELESLLDYSMPNGLWAKQIDEQLFYDAMVESSPDIGAELHSFGEQVLDDIISIEEDIEAMSMLSFGFTLPYTFEESLSDEHLIYDLWGH